MNLIGTLQILVYFLILVAVTKPMGIFMAKVFEGQRTFLHPALRPIEVSLYKITGVNEQEEMSWQRYSISMLLFSAVGGVLS